MLTLDTLWQCKPVKRPSHVHQKYKFLQWPHRHRHEHFPFFQCLVCVHGHHRQPRTVVLSQICLACIRRTVQCDVKYCNVCGHVKYVDSTEQTAYRRHCKERRAVDAVGVKWKQTVRTFVSNAKRSMQCNAIAMDLKWQPSNEPNSVQHYRHRMQSKPNESRFATKCDKVKRRPRR